MGASASARPVLALHCARLQREPTLAQVVALVDAHAEGIVLSGRWGLPEQAPATARVLVVGVEPEPVEAGDPFAALDGIDALRGVALDGTIGGGLFGWLGYDLSRQVERSLGPQGQRPAPLADAYLGWFGDLLRRAPDGTWWVEALLPSPATAEQWQAIVRRWQARVDAAPKQAPAGALGPMQIRGGAGGHRAAVAETIERIRAGELFQANVCLRLEGRLDGSAAGLVPGVLERTDPWYGGWIKAPGGQSILSASPELFLQRQGTGVRTGPIKGTAPRGASNDPATDSAALALRASGKDHAEHVMIVDLMRNDLGRVCDYGSIRPDPVPALEPHAGVWHLVSTVRGTLHEGIRDGRLVRATFPPGSVTGAPKVQAMRVIDAVEGTGREVYTGAHGLLSPVSGLELAVTIRTLEFSGAQAWLGVGGGIVAESQPQGELDEALGKAAALLAAAGSRVADDEAAGAPLALGSVGLPWMPSAARRPDPAGGLLETIGVRGGEALRLDEHLARLRVSAQELGVVVPEDLRERALATIAASGAKANGRLRMLLVPGQDVRVELVAFSQQPGAVRLEPVVVPGGLGAHKWADRTLLGHLPIPDGTTALLVDADGDVLEASWASVWWEQASTGQLCTPQLDGRILPGLSRAALLRAAPTRCAAVPAPALGELAHAPLLLSSARGLTVARLASTPRAALDRATALVAELAVLLD